MIDSIGWGNAPTEFTEESPASVLENGKSLERYPGGEEGNAQDRNDNSKDFFLAFAPSPQNSGSIPTPSEDQPVAISLSGPTSVEPGSAFSYTLTIANVSTEDLPNTTVEMLIPLELIVKDLTESVTLDEQELLWQVGDLPAGDEQSMTLNMEAPWAYLDFLIDTLFASSGDGNVNVFASLVLTRIEGGIIAEIVETSGMSTHTVFPGFIDMHGDMIEHELEPKTRLYFEQFWQCSSCKQIYWEGSHVKHMTALTDEVLNSEAD